MAGRSMEELIAGRLFRWPHSSPAGSSEQGDQGSQSHPKAHPRANELDNVNSSKAAESGLGHQMKQSDGSNKQWSEDTGGESFTRRHWGIMEQKARTGPEFLGPV